MKKVIIILLVILVLGLLGFGGFALYCDFCGPVDKDMAGSWVASKSGYDVCISLTDYGWGSGSLSIYSTNNRNLPLIDEELFNPKDIYDNDGDMFVGYEADLEIEKVNDNTFALYTNYQFFAKSNSHLGRQGITGGHKFVGFLKKVSGTSQYMEYITPTTYTSFKLKKSLY